MTNEAIRRAVIAVLAKDLGKPEAELTDDTSLDSLEEWEVCALGVGIGRKKGDTVGKMVKDFQEVIGLASAGLI